MYRRVIIRLHNKFQYGKFWTSASRRCGGLGRGSLRDGGSRRDWTYRAQGRRRQRQRTGKGKGRVNMECRIGRRRWEETKDMGYVLSH